MLTAELILNSLYKIQFSILTFIYYLFFNTGGHQIVGTPVSGRKAFQDGESTSSLKFCNAASLLAYAHAGASSLRLT
jgi:hypothetical protein